MPTTKRKFRDDEFRYKEVIKEWEDVRCPVCMDHPHNAVLLICSSHDNGCKTFICDNSYRHSNCLDQYRKALSSSSSSSPNFLCPCCRGEVTCCKVVDAARKYMNMKRRECALQHCKFRGNYEELRVHARLRHPHSRPSMVSSVQQRNWERRMEEWSWRDSLTAVRPFGSHDYDYWDQANYFHPYMYWF